MYYDFDDLTWVEKGNGWQYASVELDKGDWTDNVASTKRMVYGPATVEFWKCPSGAIEEVVS